MSFYKRHHSKIWFGLMAVTMLFGFFILGPLVQTNLIDNLKPYIVVDYENWDYILHAPTSGVAKCQIPPYTPIEVTGNPSGRVVNIPMDSVPVDYLPYVHYPGNWNEWYNIFNPNQTLGPTLQKVLNIITPLLGVGFIAYVVVLWRKGKLGIALSRILPHDDED